jgi:cytochrome oxidase assembly protein ShyY1
MRKPLTAPRFNFRPVAFIVSVLLVVLGVLLGNWQTGRAQEKIALQNRLAAAARQPALALDAAAIAATSPAALEFRHVRLQGHFIDWPIALNNRPYNGRAGFYLLTPFELAGSHSTVLVARGWLPRNIADPLKLPPYETPAGEVAIEGVVRSNVGHIMQLGGTEALRPGAIVQNLDIGQFAKASGLTVAPFVVEQAGAAADGLVRDWPAPSLGVEKHQGYAFQWYALAAMAALFFIVTGFKSGTSASK